MITGHANVVSCVTGSGVRERIKFERLCRYGSRRSKVEARRAAHFPVDDALKIVAAARAKRVWIKRFARYLIGNGSPKWFSLWLAEVAFDQKDDSLTPEESAALHDDGKRIIPMHMPPAL